MEVIQNMFKTGQTRVVGEQLSNWKEVVLHKDLSCMSATQHCSRERGDRAKVYACYICRQYQAGKGYKWKREAQKNQDAIRRWHVNYIYVVTINYTNTG